MAATDDFDSARLASSDVPVDIIFVADVTAAANVAGVVPLLVVLTCCTKPDAFVVIDVSTGWVVACFSCDLLLSGCDVLIGI